MTYPKTPLHCLGYASGIAAGRSGCCMGPLAFQDIIEQLDPEQQQYTWVDTLYPRGQANGLAALPLVKDIAYRLGQHVNYCVQQQQRFLVLGGDHSSAIGTWQGAAAAYKAQGPIGLLWIDAHMDAHTPETSQSKNIHGMPLATLLGEGAPSLVQLIEATPALDPKHICLIGIRGFEPEEAAHLQSLGVHIYFMQDIQQQGLDHILTQSLHYITTGTAGYGISIDLDAFDPKEIPATGCPEPNGIAVAAFCDAVKRTSFPPGLLGIEIAEFDPSLDPDNISQAHIIRLLNTLAKL